MARSGQDYRSRVKIREQERVIEGHRLPTRVEVNAAVRAAPGERGRGRNASRVTRT